MNIKEVPLSILEKVINNSKSISSNQLNDSFLEITNKEEIDTDKVTIREERNYYVSSSINPKILLVGKKDQSKMSLADYQKSSIIIEGITEQVMNIMKKNRYFDISRIERRLSDDKNYLIVEIKQKPYEEIKIEEKKKKPWTKFLRKKDKNN